MYKEELNNYNMVEIKDEELMETNGGSWLVVAAIILICGAGLGIGIYNGYKDAESKDKDSE